jgi:hypothetical protein
MTQPTAAASGARPARKKYTLRWNATLALSNNGPFLGGDETQVELEVVTGRDSDSYIGFSVTVPIGAENEDTGFGVQFIPTAENPELAKFNFTNTHRIKVGVTKRATHGYDTNVACRSNFRARSSPSVSST